MAVFDTTGQVGLEGVLSSECDCDRLVHSAAVPIMYFKNWGLNLQLEKCDVMRKVAVLGGKVLSFLQENGL